VIITSNNHHRRLLPTECFGPPNRSILGYDRSLRSYPINLRSRCRGVTFLPIEESQVLKWARNRNPFFLI